MEENIKEIKKQEEIVKKKKGFPKEFRPSDKTNYIFLAIFLGVLIYGFLQFPFSSIFSLNQENISLELGYPFIFFELNLGNPEGFPFKIGGLVLDLLIYVAIAYVLEVTINLVFMKNPFESKKVEKGKVDNKEQ